MSSHLWVSKKQCKPVTSCCPDILICVCDFICLQFMDRLKLLLMPAKHQPDLIYLRHVPLRKVHLFTFIQILCLALLWILKSTVAAIVFPVMVRDIYIYIWPVRLVLSLAFTGILFENFQLFVVAFISKRCLLSCWIPVDSVVITWP